MTRSSSTEPRILEDATPGLPLARAWAWLMHPYVRMLLVSLASAALVFVVFAFGWRWRQSVWAESNPIRFRYDVDNAASRCLPVAADPKTGKAAAWPTFWAQYFALYDQVADAHPKGDFGLDYGPLRLLALSLWDRHLLAWGKDPRKWTDEDVAPLRHLNSLMDFLAALLATVLVWTWIGRSRGEAQEETSSWLARLWARFRHVGFAVRTDDSMVRTANPTEYPLAVPPFREMLRDGRAWLWGGAAGALVWVSPALVVVGNAWPQWDGWVVPFFLLAALLCSWRCWFSAGVVIAVGAMFKGQILLGAPVLALWPLFAGRYALAFRIVAGAVVGFALLGSPWLLSVRPAKVATESILPKPPPPSPRTPGFRPGAPRPPVPTPAPVPAPVAAQPSAPAKPNLIERGLNAIPIWGWFVTTAAGIGLMVPWFFISPRNRWWWLCAGIALVLMTWPWWRPASRWWFWGGLALVDLVLLGPWLLSRRYMPVWAAAVAAVAMLYCAPLFGGSINWWRIGVSYGTDHYQAMNMGPTYNLSAILGDRYGWKLRDNLLEEPKTPPARSRFGAADRPATPPSKLELRTALRGAYVIAILLCGLGAAIQTRRNSPRALVALAAPWVLMFALLPQMHERYLVYAGAISAIALAGGAGFGVLHIILSLLGASQMLMAMAGPNSKVWPDLARILPKTYPDAAWMVLLIAGIFLWCSLTSGRSAHCDSAAA